MTPRPAAPEKSLVRVYGWIIALVTLLTVGIALLVALERPVTYTAESRVEVLSVPTRGAPIAPNMGTEREVATSGSVAEDAAARLDSSRSAAVQGLAVSVVADTSVLVIDYSASSSDAAYKGAEAFTHSYVSTRNAEQKVRVASVITSPGVPEAGGSTDYVLIVGIGLLVGLALGIGAAWLWDRVSDRVRSPRELEKAGPPRVVSAVSLPSDGVAMSGDGRDFAFLASRLSAMTGGRREGVRILVTAPRRRSGASTVAINTAAAIAGLGRRVVLVDADLSSRGSSSLIQGSPYPGFAEVLDGSAGIEETLRTTRLPDVRLLPAGASGPVGRLDVDSLQLTLGQLAARDIVVVDAPALLTSPETLVLAGHVDLVVLVADLQQLRRRDVAATLRLLAGVDEVTTTWVTHPPMGARRARRRPRQKDSFDDDGALVVGEPTHVFDAGRPPAP